MRGGGTWALPACFNGVSRCDGIFSNASHLLFLFISAQPVLKASWPTGVAIYTIRLICFAMSFRHLGRSVLSIVRPVWDEHSPGGRERERERERKKGERPRSPEALDDDRDLGFPSLCLAGRRPPILDATMRSPSCRHAANCDRQAPRLFLLHCSTATPSRDSTHIRSQISATQI